ncbi:MAG: Maf family protein [Gammaproteobacteria bacterium]|nr:MAG: Maf family protein [Gammaproteobacteria bacterium]
MNTPPIVLGSGSVYRRELLARLVPQFEVVVPDVDESARAGEPGADLARRLARAKALHVSHLRPAAVVIASDQVAECAGRLLGKPGSAERAVAQLSACSGQTLTLHTAVCICAPQHAGMELQHLDQTSLRFHALEPEAIRRYVERDQPLDCAGSFRFEGLGAALFAEVQTRDPTAIQGLPLLWLAQALEKMQIRVL